MTYPIPSVNINVPPSPSPNTILVPIDLSQGETPIVSVEIDIPEFFD